jgi:hypothetical protein
MSFSLSSLVRFRWMIFDAIITDNDVVGFGAGLGAYLLAQPIAVRPALRDDRLGFHPRAVDDLRRLEVQPLQLLLRLLGIVERLADGVLAAPAAPET